MMIEFNSHPIISNGWGQRGLPKTSFTTYLVFLGLDDSQEEQRSGGENNSMRFWTGRSCVDNSAIFVPSDLWFWCTACFAIQSQRLIFRNYHRVRLLRDFWGTELTWNIEYIWVKSCRTGKKCLKCPNFTLTPRVFLSKPSILQPDMRKTSSASSAACVIFVEAVSIFW